MEERLVIYYKQDNRSLSRVMLEGTTLGNGGLELPVSARAHVPNIVQGQVTSDK